jgi:hypothetical protein
MLIQVMLSVMCGPERSRRLGAGVGGGRRLKASWMASRGVSASVSLNSAIFKTLNYFLMAKTVVCNN